MRKVATLLLMLLIVAIPSTMGKTAGLSIDDDQNDFMIITGLSVKQPFLDIRNVTVDYDETSDKILVKVGLFAPLPSQGPSDTPGRSSDYYYSCIYMTGENATFDTTSIVLDQDTNWSSAYLRSQIRGNTYEGDASPVKYRVDSDSIVFTIPAHILIWGERPKRLQIMIEAGYESLEPPSPDIVAGYYDRAPGGSGGTVFLTLEVPPAPPNIIPLIVLAVFLVPAALATWRLTRRRGSRSRRRNTVTFPSLK